MTLAHGPWRVPKAPVHRHELRKFLAEVCHWELAEVGVEAAAELFLVKMLLLLSCVVFS